MTTREPGASEVLTHGLRVRPFSTAFLASSAAAIMTEGLEVLVQEVMAAMTTAPWSRLNVAPWRTSHGDRLDVRQMWPLVCGILEMMS